jgi:hypothetical protein
LTSCCRIFDGENDDKAAYLAVAIFRQTHIFDGPDVSKFWICAHASDRSPADGQAELQTCETEAAALRLWA